MTGTPIKHDVIEDVEIARDGRPLGLGISGGTDAPIHPDDPAIYISNIVQVRIAYPPPFFCVSCAF